MLKQPIPTDATFYLSKNFIFYIKEKNSYDTIECNTATDINSQRCKRKKNTLVEDSD